MLQIKPKTTTTLLGWLITLSKTMDCRLSNKILQLNSAHGKGTFHVPISNQSARTFGYLTLLIFSLFLEGVWDAEGGGGKTGAERAALHGFEINTAYDLYTFLKQHHSTVTNSYHEALHQVDKRDLEFHYCLHGTFLAYHPRR